MNWYPNGCRHDKKKEVEVGRWETVRVIWETGIVYGMCKCRSDRSERNERNKTREWEISDQIAGKEDIYALR